MSDESQINVAIALVNKFDTMSPIQKMGFANAMAHCACPACKVLRDVLTANLFQEIFKGPQQ